jgi:hypothetical protein
MRRNLFIATGVLLVAACQSTVEPRSTDFTAQPPPTAMPAPAQDTQAEMPSTEAPAAGQEAEAPPEPAAPVAVRQGLVATNPATVDLAGGSPKLVEFFAFW